MKNISLYEIKNILDDLVDDSITSYNQFPKSEEMLNLDKAVNRFIQAVSNKEKILIIHDSDVDGLGTYLLSYYFFMRFNYENLEVIITDRTEGYGFISKHIHDRKDNLPNLIITADQGITSHDACDLAKEFNIDVIITDHHQVDKYRGLPDAIVVDPHQEADSFPYPDINGTFVYWYFLRHITEKVHVPIDMYEEFKPELMLTTISDVMPLKHINRFVVKEGLKVVNSHPRQWLRTHCNVLGKTEITAEDLAFSLIPMLNSTGRLTSAEESGIFLTRENPIDSTKWYEYLVNLNKIRKERSNILFQEIQNLYQAWLDAHFIVIPGDDTMEKGILGPTAGKLSEQYKRPALVMKKIGDYYQGSGRSYGKINILDLIKDNPYVVQDKTGGHKAAMAARIKVSDLNNFWLDLQKKTSNLDRSLFKDPSKEPLGILNFGDINDELYHLIDSYQPYGEGFQKPIFATKCKIIDIATISKDKNHYSMTLESDGYQFRAMWFFFTDKLSKGNIYNLAYTINKDDYNKGDLVLFIKDVLSIDDMY